MTNVEIRAARDEDVDGVLEIVQHWSRAHGDRAERGYLRHEYDRSVLAASVARGWCAVAVEGGHVLSLYLVHDGARPADVEARRVLIDGLVADGRLPEGRYALTLVSATRDGSSGRGLSRATLNGLREQVSDEFDYFVGIGSTDNTATQRSAVRMGWHVIGPALGGVLGVAATTDEGDAALRRVCLARSDRTM